VTSHGWIALCANGMDGGPCGGGFGKKSVEIAEIFLEFSERPGIERRRSAFDREGELRFLLL